ncbi:unnamed protein product, partial [Brenthis ino]
MEEYLLSAYNKFESNKYKNITIVLGNESCDLDSVVSSIVYATYLNWKNTSDNNIQEELFIPILDVDREDLPLKTEVAFCLNKHGISQDKLIFRNDINFQELVNLKKVRIVLVDHHILSEKFCFLVQYVQEIFDHRPLDNTKWSYKEDVVHQIEVIGSCATLIGQKIKDSHENDFFIIYPQCAKLLHNVIILDTVNFSKEVNKGTPLDEQIVLYLENVLNPVDSEKERKTILDDLLRARSDVSHLTPSQLLRKDLKIINDVLVPSFPILVKDFLQKSNALESVKEALMFKKCTIALLLGMDLREGLRRDGLVLSLEEKKGEEFTKFLQNWTNPALELVLDPEINKLYFKQNNLSASRKQYVPAVCEFVKKKCYINK